MNVYKYRSGDKATFERDLFSLVENYFWASTRFELNDPCEGLFSQDMLDTQLNLIEKLFTKNNPKAAEAFIGVRKSLSEIIAFSGKSGIYSLSTTATDELLWAHYGNAHKGFCIEYDIGQLIDFTKTENHKVPVLYSSRPPKLDVSDISNINLDRMLQKLLGTKSKKWEYEKEVRVITSKSGRQSYDYRAVKAVYFGLRMPEELQDRIMRELSGRGAKYHKMNMADDYSFFPLPLEDAYVNAQKYKYSIAPILDWAITPEYVNEKYKKFVDYLFKAAEIVRREPYCNAVEMVEFSVEKSSPEKPVIFVQYKRDENRYVNHYLTLLEIDEQYAQIADLEN